MGSIRAGITVGDINGIGLEVIIKTLAHPSVMQLCTPVIYGSSKVVSYHKNIVNPQEFTFHTTAGADKIYQQKINVVNCWQDNVNIALGKETEEGGRFAHISLDRAVRDLKDGHIDLLVTAPINKNAMRMAGFQHTGHTEYLAHEFGTKDGLMMMISDSLRVALVTSHLPLHQVSSSLTKELLQTKLNLLISTLKTDFGILKPVIAVLGLNPHAGESGTMGREEEDIIRPVIIEAKKSGDIILGPYPADGFFGSMRQPKYDAVLAMYHDQGLIPFKMLHFHDGVNFTAGLPFVRTSPDHGTAFEIAGKNEADPSSFRAALFSAIDIYRLRDRYKKDTANAVRKTPKPSEIPEET
ncbi:MAG TPA: 4-hydroxythreonine-4-phosphate dehydrogenase PdxA [Saprospiraceae bacterium]|nr:4-hydroxythreonine-4-phosphate dehydrogenase PdxA [Saprospiraceae bacterium]